MEIEDAASESKYFARGSISFEAVPKSRKRRYFIGILVIVFICALIVLLFVLLHKSHQNGTPDFYRDSPLREFDADGGGAVCSDGTPCSVIGRNILKRTGSAIDSAIATLFCSGLYVYQSMGIGGGFHMVYYQQSLNKAFDINARERAPLNSTKDMFNGNPELSKSGGLACAVPGELKGYYDIHSLYGSKNITWRELIQPTYDLCMNGYHLTKHQYDSVFISLEYIKNDTYLRSMFIDEKTGNVKPVGTLIKHPNNTLCNTYKRLMDESPNTFYEGSLGDDFIADVKEAGGIISKQDLLNYKTRISEPIRANLSDGSTVFSSTLPGSGILLTFALKVLDGYHVMPEDLASLESRAHLIQRIVEVFKHVFAFRTRFGDVPLDNSTAESKQVVELMHKLMSDEYAQEIRSRISVNSTSNNVHDYGDGGAVYIGTTNHGTSHISVLAPNGDAVSVTSSVNIFFGAGTVGKRTGILFNSGMDDFSNVGFSNYFGLPPSPVNFIVPGRSPMTSLTPTIVTHKNGTVRLVIGAAGGPKITTSTAYVILRHLWLKEDLKKAVDSKRIHHQLTPMYVEYEHGFPSEIVESLKKIGHAVKEYNVRGSVVCSISKNSDRIEGNADFRKEGDVCGFDTVSSKLDEGEC